jgi:hypothetical protein
MCGGMYSLVFKCWAILLSFCLTAFPLYAQVHDSALVAHGTKAERATHRADEPSTAEIQSEAREIDPVIDLEEIRLNANYLPPRNDTVSSPDEGGLQEPDEATRMKDYSRGKTDGKRDTRGKPFWILAGLSGTGICICFSVAGIGLALAVPYYPPPPAEMLVGKSTSYIEGYYEGYTARSRWKNAGWATLGCVIAVAIDFALNYPITFGNIHVDADHPE